MQEKAGGYPLPCGTRSKPQPALFRRRVQ